MKTLFYWLLCLFSIVALVGLALGTYWLYGDIAILSVCIAFMLWLLVLSADSSRFGIFIMVVGAGWIVHAGYDIYMSGEYFEYVRAFILLVISGFFFCLLEWSKYKLQLIRQKNIFI